MQTYHVQILETLLKTNPCRETILHARANDELIRVEELSAELGCCLVYYCHFVNCEVIVSIEMDGMRRESKLQWTNKHKN